MRNRKRGLFSLSHTRLLTGDMGELLPVGIVEVNPGDAFRHSTSALVRCAPMLAPVMHPVRVSVHHWFVPHRIVWEDFEDFITGGEDGNDASVFPTITIGGGSGAAVGSLADYLGVPTGVNNIEVSALPFRAYAMIWNEWYRDQDLQTDLTIDLTSGADTTTSTALQSGCWEKDYYTSSRPWTQKGPSVTIPLGTSAPIERNPSSGALAKGVLRVSSTGNVATGSNSVRQELGDMEGGGIDLTYDPNGSLVANLSGATAADINLIREAFAIQRYQENRARYGSRYTEYLRYLGIRSADSRLQRPEYLGGGRQTIQFSEVLQTAEGTNPVGELRGHGIAGMRSNRYIRHFEEHGYVISLMCVRPKTIYVDGLPRHFNRRTKEDFWQQELQAIGQQEVLNKEVYAAHASPNGTFGYQDRYDEYRRHESAISGEFRTSTLNYWHFARDFGSTPALNSDFVKCVPTDVPFAVPSEDVLYIMAKHSIQARRLVAQTGHSYVY